MQQICKKFNTYNFHDSKLISFRLIRNEMKEDVTSEDICFEMELLKDQRPGHYKWKKAKLTLKDCRIVRMNLDLLGKRWCSDDIDSAGCEAESPLKNYIQREYFQKESIGLDAIHWSENALAEYLHFNITLVQPGGAIDIFAKDFELDEN